jgi:translation initiation factor IF-1
MVSPNQEAAVRSQLRCSGIVTAAVGNYRFRVTLDSGHEVLAHLAGKLIKNYIYVVPGDSVTVEISEYDTTRGRIVTRN